MAADEPAAVEEPATSLPYALAGVGDKTVRKLVEAGFDSIDAVAGASIEQLSEVPGIGEKTAGKILAAARGEPSADARGEPSADAPQE